MSDEAYYVWSNEHMGWWGPGERGYVHGLAGAGVYTRDHAIRICRHALPTAMHVGRISEIPVRREDVEEFMRNQMIPEAVYNRKAAPEKGR